MLIVENLDTNTITVLMNEAPSECAMCARWGYGVRWAVPWYCGPVAEGESEGGYKSVCRHCHDRWAAWNDSLMYYGA